MRRTLRWGALAAYMAALLLASGHPTPPGADLAKDYVLHAAAYAVMGLLALWAFHGGARTLAPRPTGAALALTVAYGAVNELLQALVPGRHPSLRDWLADGAGAVAALVIAGAWVGLRGRLVARDAGRGSTHGT